MAWPQWEYDPLAEKREKNSITIDFPGGVVEYQHHLNRLAWGGETTDLAGSEPLNGANYETIKQTVLEINHDIAYLRDAGEPPEIAVDGRPQFRVISFQPFDYEAYQGRANGTPRLKGSLALNRLLAGPRSGGGANVYCIVDHRGETFGFRLNTIAQLDRIALAAGLPEGPGLQEHSDTG